ncbi:MAG TPA: hypothetical protein VM939_10885 [Gemmatimonadaceae bacterium]|nr:hypothetical protein [Gemmatimonadaceae bacterium]
MRIERLRTEATNEGRRVAADVIWENFDQAAGTLVVETTEPFASKLEPSADAFLVGLLPSAQWHGEKRIRIEGSISPRLRDGLSAVTELFSIVHGCKAIRIEAGGGFIPTVELAAPRAACFMSGGIDALSLLRANRLDYPEGHPASIRDCVFLFGLNTYDFDSSGHNEQRLDVSRAYRSRLELFSDGVGATLVPMHTNIRSFYRDWQCWMHVGYGAGTIFSALCLPGRISRVEIGSAGLGIMIPPEGSHPWIDPDYSTETITVHHAQTVLNRLEKTRIVADWTEGMSVLRSCYYRSIPRNGLINCGECEKCIRTMLALAALGKLNEAPTFPTRDVTAAMVDSLNMESNNDRMYLLQCREPLKSSGRVDLVAAIDRKISRYRREVRKQRLLARARSIVGRRLPPPFSTESVRSRP